MDRLRNILAATDLSKGGSAALAEAARLAALGPSDLHVLHVVRDETSNELKQFLGAHAPATDPVLLKQSQDALEEQLRELGITPSSVRVTLGNPIQQIVETARDVAADLLVVGASGNSGRAGVGTTAVRCVRKVPTKVLVVPPGGGGPFHRTLACIDFSALSPVVVEQAARVGHLDDSAVTAVHCYQMPWERARWGQVPPNSSEVEEHFRDVLESRFANELKPHAHGHPVSFRPVVHHDFGDGIVDFARSQCMDIVVLGTTGRTSLAYMLLGTTAEKIMRSIGCAVLAVKLPGMGITGAPDKQTAEKDKTAP